MTSPAILLPSLFVDITHRVFVDPLLTLYLCIFLILPQSLHLIAALLVTRNCIPGAFGVRYPGSDFAISHSCACRFAFILDSLSSCLSYFTLFCLTCSLGDIIDPSLSMIACMCFWSLLQLAYPLIPNWSYVSAFSTIS
ncbi:hypothetical protein BJX63DRAFT_348735 [Aspergillus granulosus]|uniref:Uncharacterized protein n=1 Tax=Aspergillus granulosus TaxID=176169 RepID=A0ABR4H2D4_9EURO